MVTSLLDCSEGIIRAMKDGNGKRTFALWLLVTMSCYPWDSNTKQTPRQPTPGLSGSQWSEDLFHEPSQHNEPPIPGPSQASDSQLPSHETILLLSLNLRWLQHNHLRNLLLGPPLPSLSSSSTIRPSEPSPHSNNKALQEFTNMRPMIMIPQPIVHEYINQIFLEHRQFLLMIPFVDVTHQNEMCREFQVELNSLLGNALEAYPVEEITGIISKVLQK
ncbi:hypothetical protein O181_045686 [Austropuccinia psidii MF-1]|uniref:Uncharacterized protein n=1 Tax=Austropuccinia psidii MF-1 TaxID=1389203 RepID=A0A9Q3DSR8_9BASI|nr:hypothetical protein [Austropuccinia psidii MF-1]